MREAEIQQAIMREFGTSPTLRLWRMNTGTARDPRSGQVVKFGVPGQADLGGIMRVPVGAGFIGVRFEVEVKSSTGVQSEAQKNYQAMIESHGGVYILARSVEDVHAGIATALGRFRNL